MNDLSKSIVRITDDDEYVLKAMKSVLESEGFRVRTYASGEELLIEDAYSVPGCLVLDLKMPKMNGLELQGILKERGFKHPIIFLTAHGEVESAVLAMKGGAVDFLQKPADPALLIETVKKALLEDSLSHGSSLHQRKEHLEKLSPREYEVIKKVLQGLSNKQVGEALGLSERTVENHRNSAYKKLAVSNLKDLKEDFASFFN